MKSNISHFVARVEVALACYEFLVYRYQVYDDFFPEGIASIDFPGCLCVGVLKCSIGGYSLNSSLVLH